MALHPDDPPFPVFGIPRIASYLDDLNVFRLCTLSSNGLTFCSGIFGGS